VNWGLCCRGTNSTYTLRMGRSAHITGPYLDRDGADMLQAGGSRLLESSGHFVGPGHPAVFAENGLHWLSCHFYDRAREGRPRLALFRLRWDAEGWPALAASAAASADVPVEDAPRGPPRRP
jgi:arabinan endo-1,5-alpha-L-arabinosidase